MTVFLSYEQKIKNQPSKKSSANSKELIQQMQSIKQLIKHPHNKY
jgi:hypothetical protein